MGTLDSTPEMLGDEGKAMYVAWNPRHRGLHALGGTEQGGERSHHAAQSSTVSNVGNVHFWNFL